MRRFLFPCLLIALLLLVPTLSVESQTPVYLSRGNIFSEHFKDPVEKLIFIAYNGNSYVLTNFHESSVAINYDEFKFLLGRDKIEIEDIMCVIHNHTGNLVRFSNKDLQFYRILRSEGFKGWFLLWSSFRQKVTDWRYI